MTIPRDKHYLVSAICIVAFWPFSYLTVEALFGTPILPYGDEFSGGVAMLVVATIAFILFVSLCIGIYRQPKFRWVLALGVLPLLAYSAVGTLFHLLLFACFTDGSCL